MMQLKIKLDLIVTVGAVQSNHARQTAAACAILGLRMFNNLRAKIG